EAQAPLDRMAGRLQARSLPVRTHVVFHERPAAAILDAHAHDVDLLAFTTRGPRALPWWFLGTTADRSLCATSTPVLVQGPRPISSTRSATITSPQEPQAADPLTLSARTAADLMTPSPVSISQHATVKEAAAFLTTRGFSAAPVIDDAGRPV